MNFWKITRLVIVLLLISVALLYICMSWEKERRTPYVVTSFKSRLTLTGDYHALITIQDTIINLQESIQFTKKALDTFISKQYINTHPILAKNIPAKDSFISSLVGRGWRSTPAISDSYRLQRLRRIPYKIGFFTKTKIISVPLLFTSQKIDSVLQRNPNQTLVHFESPAAVNYILSSASAISLLAKKGSVIETYPFARRHNLLDEKNNEVFRFRPRDINSFIIDGQGTNSTTINLKLLNSKYNNFIGRHIAEWSVTEIFSWTLTAVMALFADKLKTWLLKPMVDKIVAFFKRDQTRTRN